jgi:mRNA interferase MazF
MSKPEPPEANSSNVEAPWQWQLVRADLEPVRGSEQAGVRPVLIISTEASNRVLPVVTVLAVTSLKPGRRIYSTEALLPARAAGQPRDSIVMAQQIRVLDKTRLLTSYGTLSDEEVREAIRAALRRYLDLET